MGHHGPNEDTTECEFRRLDTQQAQLVGAQAQFGETRSNAETARIIKLESLFECAQLTALEV